MGVSVVGGTVCPQTNDAEASTAAAMAADIIFDRFMFFSLMEWFGSRGKTLHRASGIFVGLCGD
jgi:hypothetical protein